MDAEGHIPSQGPARGGIIDATLPSVSTADALYAQIVAHEAHLSGLQAREIAVLTRVLLLETLLRDCQERPTAAAAPRVPRDGDRERTRVSQPPGGSAASMVVGASAIELLLPVDGAVRLVRLSRVGMDDTTLALYRAVHAKMANASDGGMGPAAPNITREPHYELPAPHVGTRPSPPPREEILRQQGDRRRRSFVTSLPYASPSVPRPPLTALRGEDADGDGASILDGIKDEIEEVERWSEEGPGLRIVLPPPLHRDDVSCVPTEVGLPHSHHSSEGAEVGEAENTENRRRQILASHRTSYASSSSEPRRAVASLPLTPPPAAPSSSPTMVDCSQATPSPMQRELDCLFPTVPLTRGNRNRHRKRPTMAEQLLRDRLAVETMARRRYTEVDEKGNYLEREPTAMDILAAIPAHSQVGSERVGVTAAAAAAAAVRAPRRREAGGDVTLKRPRSASPTLTPDRVPGTAPTGADAAEWMHGHQYCLPECTPPQYWEIQFPSPPERPL